MNLKESFLLLALVAEIIGTIGGVWSSIFFTAVFHLSSNLSKIFLFKKGLNKFLLLYIGAPSVVFVILGGYLSKIVKSDYLEVILGVFLIALALLFLIKKNLVIKAEKKESIIGGSLSGLTAGLLGTGGAIRGLTMAAFNLEKSVFIATSAFIDFMIDFSRTIVYYQNGYIGSEEIKYVPFLFVIGLVGTFIGKKILNYIPQSKFKRISLVLILVIGVFTLVNYYVLQ